MKSRPRPMDWVANDDCWNQRLRPVVTNPNANVIDAGYRHSNVQGFALTSHADIVEQDPPVYAFPQLEQTAVRVVGNVHFGVNSDLNPSQSAYMLHVNMRVAVATQVVGTMTASDTGTTSYDMGTPWVANEDFLWHFHSRFIVDTDYWADEAVLAPDWRAPQRIDIDIRVSRRLKQREVLVLYCQSAITEVIHATGEFVFNPEASTRVWFDPQVRTLVRTIT